ncbi:MAG: T9SS type A sorting domain-containing protein [candidate division KSB1 bacterium]|nr:T9SS type A sorting domain-containing protein [candidate division KSB1 bacterium]MDZ7365792.1 T9SS type A sorting domain-containing protein [candidate division KSB1 bacterium]MDZ7403729.1 T9SS type A sorting domain-containing protein [candidate division KSB1 bacterium]
MTSRVFNCSRFFGIIFCGWLMILSAAMKVSAQIGAPISANTKFGFKKSNQSKVFYHDSQWWALALNENNNRWEIWRYNGASWLATNLAVQNGNGFYCDAVLNTATGKLYLFSSHHTTSRFHRFSYLGGNWHRDAGYPVVISGFANPDQNNPGSLVRAKNGELWIFRIRNNILQAKRSTDEGLSWSNTINVKTGLTTANGTTDAAAFTFSGADYVGVAYGLGDAVGSHFGFLRHADGSSVNVWIDESSALNFFSVERANNQISLTADAGNNLYLLTRNGNAGNGSRPANSLYKRRADGVWEKFKVNTASARAWKSPVLAIDGANNRLYAMGVNIATLSAEYKSCLLGQEANLDTAAVSMLLSSPGDQFGDLSAPAENVDAIRGLMVLGENLSDSDIWFRHLSTGTTLPLIVGNVSVVSNQVNANATYTIPLTLSNNGALNAGVGTISFRFPGNTFVPNNMPASAVLVNGTPCTTVISNSASRQVSLTVPVNLSNNQSFSVVFNSAAGLLNPTTVSNGNTYRLTAWTSSQPTQVNSPRYNIVAATTTVTPATVRLANSLMSACSTYTVSFNLGAHGRLLSGTSTITLTFNTATTLVTGPLSGVTVNGVAAAATGDNAMKTITVTLPATVSVSNSAAIAIALPKPIVCNPSANGSYTMTVSTSVETTPVVSNIYRIAPLLTVGGVSVAPSQISAPASYTISLTLASNGSLTAGADALTFIFPSGTVVSSTIVASQILVNGTPSSVVVSDVAARRVQVTTPVNLANNAEVNVTFKTGAGVTNPPGAGNYALQAFTSVQTYPVASPFYAITADTGSAIATSTKSGYKKSNQSKVFYHDNQWWAIAFYEPENRWYIWKYNGAAWLRTTSLDKGLNYQWDAVLNAALGKLYLIGSHTVASDFRRYSYVGGEWKRDAGFSVSLADFTGPDASNPVSLAQAKNGSLWLFRVMNNMLQAKRSTDGGLTWSAPINLKTGLTTAAGVTDAVAFTAAGKNYVGVAYAEQDNPSPISRFGFLKHRDSDADTVWSDESSSLTFFGSERAHNALCLTADQNENLYIFARTITSNANDPRNILYKRGGGGAWFKYKVNASPTLNWKTPAIALDRDNGVIYTLGVNLNTSLPEYKVCAIGQESTLENAPASRLFAATSSAFDDLSVPAANFGSTSGLMVTIDNVTANDIWYRHVAVTSNMPVTIGNITVASNEVNANAAYTIPLTLSANGGLNAGSGMINFIFPNNTHVPNNMPASAVTVNGTPAATVLANTMTRQVSVTTPVNLSGNQSFSVIFTPGAGLLNPTTVDSTYKITAWTSSQPAQVNSPNYSLRQATTTITPAVVTLLTTDPDSMADYTLNFNLGAHGRLLSGSSQFVVKFNGSTQITHGVLSSAKINSVDAAASGDSAARQITVTLPATVSLSNNSPVTLYLPKSAARNPAVVGDYTLTVATSVETTAVASNPYAVEPYNGVGRPIPGTTEKFDRNNQSKMFYHAGFWWVTAQSKVDQKWYLWKFDGVSWSQNILISAAGKSRPDCILEASNNRVYILLPGPSTTSITRLKYASGVWSVDSGYPYPIPDFAQTSDRGITLARASNSDLWVFMIRDSTLYAKKSSNAGKTWSASRIAVKRHLHNHDGLTDAVAFTFSGGSYIGVGYAENSAPGSIYGFLRHNISDNDTVWIDETASIPQFANTISDDHISMAVYNNAVFMIIKTNGGGPTTTNVGLLHRASNGVWTQYPILLSTGWTRPVLAIDATNNMLYVAGVREGGFKVGEMKKVAIGNYGALVSAPIDTIFRNASNVFFNISVAAHTVNSTTKLLICANNETRKEVWHNFISLGVPKAEAETADLSLLAEEDSEGVKVFPNPFNPHTSFHFKLKEKAPVKLQIFNLNGQLVRTLIDAEMEAGVHQKRWNGRAENGAPAASGVYFYRLHLGRKIFNGRIQMIK